MLAAGKAGTIFVVETDTGKMGEFNPNENNVYQEIPGQVAVLLGAAAYFDGSVYYGPIDDNFKAYQLNANNTLSTTPDLGVDGRVRLSGADPDVSADGTSDGIVWGIDTDAFGIASARPSC